MKDFRLFSSCENILQMSQPPVLPETNRFNGTICSVCKCKMRYMSVCIVFQLTFSFKIFCQHVDWTQNQNSLIGPLIRISRIFRYFYFLSRLFWVCYAVVLLFKRRFFTSKGKKVVPPSLECFIQVSSLKQCLREMMLRASKWGV